MSVSVAVLMACHNGERYLEEQIVSILEQRQVNVTVYLNDDCSNDGSQNLLQKYVKQSRSSKSESLPPVL